jgi:glucose-1-phosphate thymidylyltransferase
MGITAVLLAAGYATRLFPLTQDRPKALLPLNSGTMLDAVCRSLDTVPGVARCVLVTNHRFAEQFRAWQRAHRADLAVIDDGTETVETRLGAIRDLALAAQSAGPADDLLVVGTDNLFRWPLAQFVAQAQRVHPAPSVALWNAPSRASATQFGVVIRDRDGRITAFAEKSPQPPSTEVALCVYYFPAPMRGQIEVFLGEAGNADAPGYFVKWLAQRRAVYGIMMPGPWYDIGTLEAYQQVLQEWQQEGG